MTKQISITEVCNACREGEIDQLIKWKADGSLPELQQANHSGPYPHEIAAQHGQLDVLKWLVEECNTNVTTNDNYALRIAAAREHFMVVKWLVAETGQAVDLAADNNFVLNKLIDKEQSSIARFLLESTSSLARVFENNCAWLEKAPRDFQAEFRPMQEVCEFARNLKIPIDERDPYMRSRACQQAVHHRLVPSKETLDALLEKKADALSKTTPTR